MAGGSAHLEEKAREKRRDGGEVHEAREDVVEGVEVRLRLHLQCEEEDGGAEAGDELHEAARPHEGHEADKQQLAVGLHHLPVEEARLIVVVQQHERARQPRLLAGAHGASHVVEQQREDQRRADRVGEDDEQREGAHRAVLGRVGVGDAVRVGGAADERVVGPQVAEALLREALTRVGAEGERGYVRQREEEDEQAAG